MQCANHAATNGNSEGWSCRNGESWYVTSGCSNSLWHSLRDCFLAVEEVQEHWIKPRLSAVGTATGQRRLQWAHCRQDWPAANRHHMMFSDESRFMLDRHDGCQQVDHWREERYSVCVQQTDCVGGGSVMMWEAIYHGWRSNLIEINGNLYFLVVS